MSIRLDQVLMSSLHESFRNRQQLTASLTAGGSIPPGGKAFTVTVPVQHANSIIEAYYQRVGGTARYRTDIGGRMLDSGFSFATNCYVTSVGASNVQITIAIFNPNAFAVTESTQTFNFTLYVFDAPF